MSLWLFLYTVTFKRFCDDCSVLVSLQQSLFRGSPLHNLLFYTVFIIKEIIISPCKAFSCFMPLAMLWLGVPLLVLPFCLVLSCLRMWLVLKALCVLCSTLAVLCTVWLPCGCCYLRCPSLVHPPGRDLLLLLLSHHVSSWPPTGLPNFLLLFLNLPAEVFLQSTMGC